MSNAVGSVFRNLGGTVRVRTEEGFYDCKIRGSLQDGICIGDRVVIDTDHLTVEKRLERRNQLLRPVVANVEYVLLVFAASDPSISYTLLDKMLVTAEHAGIEPVICINKMDLDPASLQEVQARYALAGYLVISTAAETGEGIETVKELLKGKITVLAGPSGVGKTTILSKLTGLALRTGEVSKAANRGKHTTRHSEFYELECGGILADSPGFGAVDLSYVGKDLMRECFPEFAPYKDCKFADCMHVNEPGCAVRAAVEEGKIPSERYESYLRIMEGM